MGGLVYANRGLFTPPPDKQASVFDFDTGSQYRFAAQDGRLIAVNAEGMLGINQNGGRAFAVSRPMTKPVFQTAGSHTLMFDRGGTDVAVYSGGALVWEAKTEQPLITAKINEKGYAAVVTYEVGYKARIEVRTDKGEAVYHWRLGENYVVDVDLSPDGKRLAAVILSSAAAKLTSKVTVVDIDGEKILGEVLREDSLIFAVKYQKGGDLVAVGEDELLGISSKGVQKWAVSFENRTLQKYAVPDDSGAVLCFGGGRNNSLIEAYGSDGKKTGEYVSETEIKSLDAGSGGILVSEQRSLTLLSYKGRAVATAQTEREIRSVLLLSGKKAAVVLSNSVKIIKL